MTDADFLILGFMAFAWLFLLGLGHAINRMYLILSFFVGTVLTVKIYDLVGHGDDGLIIAAVFISIVFTLPWFLGDD